MTVLGFGHWNAYGSNSNHSNFIAITEVPFYGGNNVFFWFVCTPTNSSGSDRRPKITIYNNSGGAKSLFITILVVHFVCFSNLNF